MRLDLAKNLMFMAQKVRPKGGKHWVSLQRRKHLLVEFGEGRCHNLPFLRLAFGLAIALGLAAERCAEHCEKGRVLSGRLGVQENTHEGHGVHTLPLVGIRVDLCFKEGKDVSFK